MFKENMIEMLATQSSYLSDDRINEMKDLHRFIIEQLKQIPLDFQICSKDMLNILKDADNRELLGDFHFSNKWKVALSVLDGAVKTSRGDPVNKATGFTHRQHAQTSIRICKAAYGLI